MTIDEWLDAGKPLNKILYGDCQELMKHIGDKEYELACVDPPYGIGASNKNFIRLGKQTGKSKYVSGINYKPKKWDETIPNDKYFFELKRISQNQIIWGVNNFNNLIGGRIVWDKDNSDNKYSDCELAYQSFTKGIRKVKIRWHGMLQENMKEKVFKHEGFKVKIKLFLRPDQVSKIPDNYRKYSFNISCRMG